ncbi:MAG TPA: TetR/AcrR family transcriptional regulator [Nocardioidaceae bacterium]|nr:TetR/AcrR family transcriptional regulator [Nocardioidaceae bacterium]
MSRSRGPGERAGLDTAQVVAAARLVVEEEGSPALSLRAVARRLGVAPNAIYSHIGNRDRLLDAVLDDVLGEVPQPSVATVLRDPVTALRSLMLDSYDVLVRHPRLMPSYLDRQGARGVQAQRLGSITTMALDRLGLDERAAHEATRVLIVNTIGFAAFSAPPSAPGERPISAAELRRNFEQALAWLLTAIAQSGPPRSTG